MRRRVFSLAIGIVLGMLAVMDASHYVTDPNIPYSAKEDALSKQRLKLDTHHHQDAKDLPVIVWFHGRMITGGEKCIAAEIMTTYLPGAMP